MTKQKEEVHVRLINQKVQFSGVSQNNPNLPPVTFDFKPPLGDGMGYNGLEAFLMSLSACSATALAFLLRKMKKTIKELEVNAHGIKTDQLPLKFEKIFLEFILHSHDTKDADIQKALQLSEESFCPVWQMIKNNVDVVTSYKIIDEE